MAPMSAINSEAEFDVFQPEMTCLDFGHIQYIIDQMEQIFTRGLKNRHIPRCSDVNSVSASRSAIPMIALSGVRISWLMFARN